MSYEIILDALANPARRKMISRLRAGPCTVGEIAAIMPISQPAVSQHLQILKRAGLVCETPAGNRRIYRIEPEGLDGLREWLDAFWSDALHAYKSALEAEEFKHEQES